MGCLESEWPAARGWFKTPFCPTRTAATARLSHVAPPMASSADALPASRASSHQRCSFSVSRPRGHLRRGLVRRAPWQACLRAADRPRQPALLRRLQLRRGGRRLPCLPRHRRGGALRLLPRRPGLAASALRGGALPRGRAAAPQRHLDGPAARLHPGAGPCAAPLPAGPAEALQPASCPAPDLCSGSQPDGLFEAAPDAPTTDGASFLRCGPADSAVPALAACTCGGPFAARRAASRSSATTPRQEEALPRQWRPRPAASALHRRPRPSESRRHCEAFPAAFAVLLTSVFSALLRMRVVLRLCIFLTSIDTASAECSMLPSARICPITSFGLFSWFPSSILSRAIVRDVCSRCVSVLASVRHCLSRVFDAAIPFIETFAVAASQF